MTTNLTKIIGWFLVFAGLGLIVHSVIVSYDYFTNKAAFPVLIETPAMQDATTASGETPVDMSDAKAVQAMMQVQIQNSVNQAIGSLVPAGSVVKMLNAAIWSVFATFMVYAGAKIAGIGVGLIANRDNPPN